MIKILSLLKRIFVVVALIVLVSCNMKVYTLLDKVTDVPKNNAVYSNKSRFTSALLNIADTAVVYEEFNRDEKMLMRSDKCTACRGYTIYKFYPNGCFNLFYFKRNSSLSIKEFDPLYTGYRGIYYPENDRIRYDFFAGIDESQHTGKITGSLTFRGDTLYVKRDDRKGISATSYSTEIYIKRKLPPEYFVYKADW